MDLPFSYKYSKIFIKFIGVLVVIAPERGKMENYTTFKVSGFSLSKALDKLNEINKTYTRIVKIKRHFGYFLFTCESLILPEKDFYLNKVDLSNLSDEELLTLLTSSLVKGYKENLFKGSMSIKYNIDTEFISSMQSKYLADVVFVKGINRIIRYARKRKLKMSEYSFEKLLTSLGYKIQWGLPRNVSIRGRDYNFKTVEFI